MIVRRLVKMLSSHDSPSKLLKLNMLSMFSTKKASTWTVSIMKTPRTSLMKVAAVIAAIAKLTYSIPFLTVMNFRTICALRLEITWRY